MDDSSLPGVHSSRESPEENAAAAAPAAPAPAQEALGTLARQQAAVAELGRHALKGNGLSRLLEKAARMVHEVMGVEYVEVLELLPEGELLLREGVGWRKELLGHARVAVGASFQDGEGTTAAEPLVAPDARTDPRLREATLLREAGVASVVRVLVGPGTHPVGILGAASVQRRTFSPSDVHFLQAIANVLGAAVARQQSERELKQLLRQQTAVAEFGFRALAGWDTPMLVRGANTLLRRSLAVEYTSFLELLPGGRELVLRAGAGWKRELLDHATVSVDVDTHAGFTLLSGEPVIIEDLRTDSRFSSSAFLSEAGVISGISVIVSGRDRPLGVLAAYTTDQRAFRQSEIDLLQSIANVLAQAIERRQTEEMLRDSEKQFRQAQKMEAVGRLAGGVAHDFNNLLTVIKGNAELGLMEIAVADPLREFLEEVIKAANRAADLTRQLLAFSRRQLLQPKVLDLNATIAVTERLLRRVIGASVTLTLELDGDLGVIEADPGQIEQVLLNLVVNACDAMPQGGHLTIATGNLTVDTATRQAYPYYVQPGEYVQLSVSDTGVGMDETTLSRLFEPFFTTKAPGEGTGLGLSTVYGIIKQSEGYVWAESRVGEGSTFWILLRRLPQGAGEPARSAGAADSHAGIETVLLVEDENAVRSLTRRILERRGYVVLEAANVAEALRIVERHHSRIHLALTDVILPGESGRVLVEQLSVLSPRTRILYMSGYTDDVIAHHGVLDPATHLLEKPFSPTTLLRRVREVLDEER